MGDVMANLASSVLKLEPVDFAGAFGEVPDRYVSERIKNCPFFYRKIESSERDACLRRIVDVLLSPDVSRAGTQRHAQWEEGWGANLNQLSVPFDFSAIVPGYFGKYRVLRWMQEFIEPMDPMFEYSSLAVIQDWVFNRYLREMDVVYEFGCGTGHNLFRVRAVNPGAVLWGLDWACSSQDILTWLGDHGVDTNLYGHRFNLFEPDHAFRLVPDAGVYTVAALEQVGGRFSSFLSYLLENKPKLCIHIEPIVELLDEGHLLDYLSVRYFKHRNYLDGFLVALKSLEAEGKLRIHFARRTYIGSLFIEGYSVVVWSPIY